MTKKQKPTQTDKPKRAPTQKKKREGGESASDRLNPKEWAFVVALMQTRSKTQAAIVAGYAANSAHVTASRLLKKAKIQAALRELYQQSAMSAEEVLSRLSQHADASLRPFYDVEKGVFVFDTEDAKANFHLIKKLKQTTRTTKDGESYTTVEVEVHDPQAALVHMGRYHKLFIDRTETKKDEDQFERELDSRKQLIDRIDKLAPKADEHNDSE